MARVFITVVLMACAVLEPVWAGQQGMDRHFFSADEPRERRGATSRVREDTYEPMYLTRFMDIDPKDVAEVEAAFSSHSGALGSGQLFAAITEAVVQTGADERLLARALAVSARWGTLEALDKIRGYFLEKEKVAVHDGWSATLADVLEYMYGQKCRYSDTGKWLWTMEEGLGTGSFLEEDFCQDSKCVFLGDDVTARLYDYDGSPLERATVAIPYGWVGGLTVFSQMNYKEVVMDLARRVRRAEDSFAGLGGVGELADKNKFVDKVVDEALTSHPLLQQLMARAGSVEWIGRVAASDLGTDDDAFTVYALASKLQPRLDAESLVHASNMAKGCHYFASGTEDTVLMEGRLGRGGYLRYLLELGTMVTMPILGKVARIAYDAMMTRVAKAGTPAAAAQPAAPAGAGGTPVVYCTMERQKSSNVVYHIIFMTTAADPRDHHFCMTFMRSAADAVPAFVDKVRGGAGLFLVDDLSISGEQQAAYAITLKTLLEPYGVAAAPIIVPLFYTDKAKNKFISEGIPTVYGRRIRDSGVGSWMLKSGFHGGLYNVAMPFMAPDNCNSFFSLYVARAFTFHGCGVKGVPPSDYRPVPPCAKIKRNPEKNQKIVKCLQAPAPASCHTWAARIEECYGSTLA